MLAVVCAAQAVAALAVGVVDHDVERGQAPELVAVLLEQREVVLVGIVVDEALHHADAVRAVAQHRVGHDLPAERLGHLVRRDLAVAQRAVAGSPRAGARPAAACRSRASRRRRRASVHEERRVRRPRHPAEQLELAVAQQLRDRATRRAASPPRAQFHRGQMCPAGSIGKSQSWHSGRPPSTASAPLRDHRPDLRTRREEPRDVAFARRRARAAASSSSSAASSRSSSSTSWRSGSKPMPISRARNSGSSSVDRRRVGAASTDSPAPRGTPRRCGRGTARPRPRAARPVPSRRAPTAARVALAAWMHERALAGLAERAGADARRRGSNSMTSSVTSASSVGCRRLGLRAQLVEAAGVVALHEHHAVRVEVEHRDRRRATRAPAGTGRGACPV